MGARHQTGQRTRRAAMLAASAALALVFSAAAPAVAAPRTQLAQANAPALEQKARLARERGFWVIEEGEHLYRISRAFTANEIEARDLARELAALNDHAYMGDPSRLVVGARLTLPRRLVVAREGVPPAPASTATPRTPATRPAPATAATAAAPSGASVPPIDPTLAAAATTPAPAKPVPYVDRLIGGVASDPDIDVASRPRDTSPGLRSWAAEARAETRDTTGAGRSSTEGLSVRYAQETERYGDVSVLLQGAHVKPPANDPTGARTRGSITIFQDQFAIGRSLVANSALGVVRPTLPAWLSTSYRVFLSPALVNGFSTIVSAPDSESRFSIGQLGQYAGYGVQQFERIRGETASASFTQRLPGEWLVGATGAAVRGSEFVADHTAVSIAAQKGFERSVDGVKFQAAATDDGELGAWVDAQVRSGRLTQRFGAFHLDPNFRFGQTQPMRDSRGAYWRGDFRSAGNFYSGGVEVSQENLRRDATRGGNDNAGAFGSLALRLDRATQLGGGLSARRENPRTASGVERDVYSGNVFVSRELPFGTARLDGNTQLSRPGAGPGERTTAYNWNQEWGTFPPVTINTLLSRSDERLVDRSVRRTTASIAARGPLYGTLRWDANVTFVDSESTQGSERNYNTALSLDWNPLPQWVMGLTWSRNRIQPGPDNPLAPFFRENAVQLNVRYEDSAGTPYPRVAGPGGRSGTGSVSGSVFFDENGDGVRQPNERGAPGVVVVLDDRQSATTDPDGRYKFALVSSGRHRVRVLLERVPLPWGLENEGPREVEVDLRGEARLDIGFTRVAP